MSDRDLTYNPYEKAYQKIEKNDTGSILSDVGLTESRYTIKAEMVEWFEKTEEFEKCSVIIDFFDKVEKDIKIRGIIKNLPKTT